MAGNLGGLTLEAEDVMRSHEAIALIRGGLGLSMDFSDYTPQLGQETLAARQRLLAQVDSSLTGDARANRIYSLVSQNMPPQLKAVYDNNPQGKASYLAMFDRYGEAYVNNLNAFYAANQQAAAAPAAGAARTYTPAQRNAIRDALRLVDRNAVPDTINNGTAQAAVNTIRANALTVAAGLRINAAQVGDAGLGQAILSKIAEERTRFLRSNPDATEAQISAHFRQNFGVQDVGAASKLATAMKNIAAAGAFNAPAAAPAAPAAPAPAPQEVTPDARTMQAMQTIRTQVFPVLDIRSSGTDVASFRQDFNAALLKLGQILKIPGDASAVRAGLEQKLNELASSGTVSAARTTYNTIKASPELVGGGERKAEETLGALLRNMDNYEQLPQAIKNKPSLLLTLLDQKDQINGHLRQIYASNILNAPQIVPAQAGSSAAPPAPAAGSSVTPTGSGAGSPAAPAVTSLPTDGRTLTADQIAAAKAVHESLYGAVTGTYGNAEALASIARVQQEALGLAPNFGIEVNPQNLPQFGTALRAKVAQHRTAFASNAGPGDPNAAYLTNLRFITQRSDITPERIEALAAGMDRLGATGALNVPSQTDRLAGLTREQLEVEAAAASVVVETALMKIGGALGQAGGGFGGMISGLAGFKPPTTADHIFDEQSQDALHMMLMGLKKLGGDKNADGTYTAAIGRQLLADILTKPQYEMVRKQYGIAGTYKPEHVRNMQQFMARVGQEDGVAAEDQEKVRELQKLFENLNILERANKLNNEKAKNVTFMGTVMDKIAQFLPENMKTWLKNFFENDKFGQMIAGFLNMFGFPVQRLWGGQAPGSQAVRQTVRDGYYSELQAANFDHAKLKENILGKMDSSVAFKAVERLLFHGAERGTVKAAVEMALDKAARESDPNKAADVFAEEMVRLGEQYQQLDPAARANYLQQVRDAYQQEVSSMPGVPAAGAAPAPQPGAAAPAPQPGAAPAPQPGAPQINPAQAGAATAAPASNGVPNYTDAQLRTVSQAMTLAGMTVPATGLTREGAKTAIEQIHAQTSSVLTKLGINAASNRYAGSYDDIGGKVAQRLAEERSKFFKTGDETEAAFRQHLKTTFGIDNAEQASNLAKAFVDIHKSGAMNLGAPQVTPAQAVAASAAPSADGSVVQTGDKRFEIILTPDTAQYTPGPTRYSYGRVVELQNILSQNSRALELSTKPEAYMRAAGGRGTDTMTRSTCMALEELAVRAQLAKGVELSAVSHRYDEATITAVTQYMSGKGMNQQDIEKFVRTVRDLEADMKSTNPRDRSAGPVQQHSVWDQSYIRNQVSVRALAPAPVVAPTAAPSAPVDRYPGIRMSPENELPPGMTVEQLFERYKQHNSNPDCPNQGPLILQHEGRAYAGVVLKDSNTFKVIELDGYLEPPGEGSRRQTLNDSDFAVLRDNYKWHNPTKAGIVAYIDNQLCLEPKAPAVAPAAAQPQPAPAAAAPSPAPASPVPPVRDQFRSSHDGAGAIPRNYWELPRLTNDHLEGLDRGCLNARELAFLYDRAVATRDIQKGGVLLTKLSPEDKARLGGDMIVSVFNVRTSQLEHRLVNEQQHRIKIGNLTENYSPTASIRRLDDFLDMSYDKMAMTVTSSSMGTRLSEDYKRQHVHSVDDALRQLYSLEPNARDYERAQREYVRGTGNTGEGGFQTRQMYRYREFTATQEGGTYEAAPSSGRRGVYTPASGHDHPSCGEFNDKSGSSRPYNDGYRDPPQFSSVWGSPINTVITFGQVIQHKTRGNEEIEQNARDCRVGSNDPNAGRVYESGGPRTDRTPGIVDPPR